MKKLLAILIAAAVLATLCSAVIVRAQSFKWSTLGPRECYWTLGTDIIVSLPSRLNEIRECTKSLIDAISNLFELKDDIGHERKMRHYSEIEIKDIRTDLEALNRLVKDLRLEIAELRAKLPRPK